VISRLPLELAVMNLCGDQKHGYSHKKVVDVWKVGRRFR